MNDAPSQAVIDAFQDVGSQQRGEPESRMRDTAHYCAGLWAHLLEHVGDITHRLTEWWPRAIFVGKKAENALHDLRRKPPDYMLWDRDVRQQFERNAEYHNIPLPEYLAELERLGEAYSRAHAKLPVYNRTLWLAREAAIALGRMDWDGAEKALAELVETGPPLLEKVKEYRLGPDGLPLEYPWQNPWLGPGEDIIKPGRYWYEYHCLESPASNDAELWYRSHQPVEVLGISPEAETAGINLTRTQRAEDGIPLVYSIRFDDGHTGEAWEDEILDHPNEFTRPDPPSRPSTIAGPEKFSEGAKSRNPRFWIATYHANDYRAAAGDPDAPWHVIELLMREIEKNYDILEPLLNNPKLPRVDFDRLLPKLRSRPPQIEAWIRRPDAPPVFQSLLQLGVSSRWLLATRVAETLLEAADADVTATPGEEEWQDHVEADAHLTANEKFTLLFLDEATYSEIPLAIYWMAQDIADRRARKWETRQLGDPEVVAIIKEFVQ